jgi:hypothetical protein
MLSKQNNNLMHDGSNDLGDKSDSILEEAKKILLANGGEIIGDEEIKMRICYKIKESYSMNNIL